MTDTTQRQHLEGIRRGLDRVEEETRRLVEPLSPEQRTWRPEPGARSGPWGVADCFAHLVETDRCYRPEIEKGMERAGAADGAPGSPWSPSPAGRFFGFLAGRKVRVPLPAPKPFRPPAEPDPEAPESFLSSLGWRREVADRAEELDLRRVRVASPILPLVRFNLGDVLAMAVEHDLRHIDQARRVTGRPGFPAGA